ncbi:MAG: hypothetical protein QOJ16_3252 [Acidobacteriota bacterium]|jgi:VWFA-related protein|nr:hypothetical protein [Acidobacteriota bacterium]
MQNRFSPAALGSTLLALALLAPAASRAKAERFDGATANVVAVEVPVEVVRDGQPVRGLSAADFEVTEGRKKQKIAGFDVVDLAAPARPGVASSPPSPSASPSIAARRHFLLLFDLTFSEPKSVVKAREAAADLVAKALHPSDLVAVATYSAAKGPQLALGFTSDRRQIAAAISALGLTQPLERNAGSDPLRLVVAETQLPNQIERFLVGKQGSQVDRTNELLDNLVALDEHLERQSRENQQDRVIGLSRSLADLARTMATVRGRKYVVYLSEGFDSTLLTGSTPVADDNHAINPNANLSSNPETQQWTIDSDARHGDTRTQNRLEKMFEQFRRADCVIQAVDIGGVRAAGGDGTLGYTRPSGKDALFSMARETGGELYENWNDLGAAMGQMLARTSVTYVLTLEPEDLRLDGAYHEIHVTLKNPRGARVIAKPGYYAPKPFAAHNPVERALDAADTIVGGVESGTIAMSVLAAPFRHLAGTTAYVPVLIEVDGPGLLAGFGGDVAPAEIYAYALDAAGGVRDFFSQNLNLDLLKVGPQLESGGLKFFGHLDLPPGDYSLRVLVRNGRTGAHSLRVVPVSVPAFAEAGPFLLPPFFHDPPGRWLLTREVPRGVAPEDTPYPFMAREKAYVPASRLVLGPGQGAELSLVAYNLGGGEVTAGARVLGVDGKEVPGAALAVTDRERGGDARPDRLTASFKAPPLAPGEYRLQVTLTAAGGARQTSSIPFVVAKPGQQG